MKRRDFSIGSGGYTEWFLLQDTNSLKESQLKEMQLRERSWVREGRCDECGVYDILSKYKEQFVCNECMALMNANSKANSKANPKIKSKIKKRSKTKKGKSGRKR